MRLNNKRGSFIAVFIVFILILLQFIACKRDDFINPNPNPNPNPTPIIDPFASYTVIEPEIHYYPELSEFAYFDQFYVDSKIYIFRQALTASHDIKLAVFNQQCEQVFAKTIIESDTLIRINDAIYIPEKALFFLVGKFYTELDYGYGYPIFLAVNPEGNIVSKKVYFRDNLSYNFYGINFCSIDKLVVHTQLVTYNWPATIYTNSLIILNNELDSIRTINIPIDNLRGIHYFDIQEDSIIQLAGFRPNDAYVPFYSEFNAAGEVLQFSMLPINFIPYGGQEGLSFYKGDPVNYYHWISYHKYYPSGHFDSYLSAGEYSVYAIEYHSLDSLKIADDYIDPGNTMTLSRLGVEKDFILNGYFGAASPPFPPVFYGNFLIKFDNEFNEKYRVIYNVDQPFASLIDQGIIQIGTDHFICIYTTYFEQGLYLANLDLGSYSLSLR